MKRVSVGFLRWLNGISFLLVLAVNALANYLPLNGVKTGAISKRYFNLFTPAEWTFAIWGLLYLLLAGFALYQAGAFRRPRGEALAKRLGGWFALSCLCNVGWLFCWHYDLIGLSTLLILGLLFTLAVLVKKAADPAAPWPDQLLGQTPFRLYFGWITAATLANLATLASKRGWNGLLVPIALLVLGALVALWVVLRGRDWVYGLAVLWAYAGILARHLSPGELAGAYPPVIAAAALCGAAVAVCVLWAIPRRK